MMAVMQEITHRAVVVSDELGQLRQGYDVRGSRRRKRVITHLSEPK